MRWFRVPSIRSLECLVWMMCVTVVGFLVYSMSKLHEQYQLEKEATLYYEPSGKRVLSVDHLRNKREQSTQTAPPGQYLKPSQPITQSAKSLYQTTKSTINAVPFIPQQLHDPEEQEDETDALLKLEELDGFNAYAEVEEITKQNPEMRNQPIRQSSEVRKNKRRRVADTNEDRHQQSDRYRIQSQAGYVLHDQDLQGKVADQRPGGYQPKNLVISEMDQNAALLGNDRIITGKRVKHSQGEIYNKSAQYISRPNATLVSNHQDNHKSYKYKQKTLTDNRTKSRGDQSRKTRRAWSATSHNMSNVPSPISDQIYRIYAPAIGRLGNNMFQYAAIYSIARTTNRIPILPPGMEILDTFQKVKNSVTVELVKNDNMTVIHEKAGGIYTSSLYKLPRRDVTVCCYFQSWKYFYRYREEIKEVFQFDDWVTREADTLLTRIGNEYLARLDQINKAAKLDYYNQAHKTQDLTYVGIHVRRGDVVIPEVMERGYRAASLTYLYKAMTYFRGRYDNVFFVVSSDDMNWCTSHLRTEDVTFTTGQDHLVDLAVLSKCNHTIMTVGTFGWWAAWMAGGHVTYYSNWPTKGTEIAALYNHADYFPPHWKPIGD